MPKIITLISLLLLLTINNCLAQDPQIEELVETDDEYSDQSELISLLSKYEKNPININTATIKQLTILPWIPYYLAKDIISYRQESGGFNDISELLKIQNMSLEIFNNISLYVTIADTKGKYSFKINTRSRLVRKLEESIGYEKGYYYNSPNKYYNKIETTVNNYLTMGALLEKDSGEKKINDFSSYYLNFQDSKDRIKFIVGNYRLAIGQGLVFWNPYSYSKGSNTIYSTKKKDRGLLNYTLVDENASLYGVGSQICLNTYQLLFFYSKHKLDATKNINNLITNFYQTGYHRTTTEKLKKDNLEETIIGSRLAIQIMQNLRIGNTLYRSRYDKPIENNNIIRSRYNFNGSSNFLYSFDFDYLMKNINIYGEYARSKNNGTGLVLGSIFSFKSISFVILYRNYAKNFHSLHGGGFGENRGNPQNEQGFYYGCQYKILPGTKISLYYDIFKYPWRTYYDNLPISGSDFLFQIEKKYSRDLSLLFRIKHKKREKNLKIKDNYQREIYNFFTENKLNLRLQLEYWPFTKLKLRGRIEKCNVDFNHKYSGLLLYQDLKYYIMKNFILYYRLSFFDTDSYESRMYQFENDLPFVLTNYMLYGKGHRWYVCIKYEPFKNIYISAKFSSTNYQEVTSLINNEYNDTISSGYNLIKGDSVHKISLQIETQL